jgi:mRNA deadenylase 3'-5' endonuclease subunit Ccr4
MHGESDKHLYARREHVRWAGRAELILQELRGLGGDVLCLQEVSLGALSSTFIPRLQQVCVCVSVCVYICVCVCVCVCVTV